MNPGQPAAPRRRRRAAADPPRTTPKLNAHVAAAIAKHSRRGGRLDKAARADKIDGVVALAMAVERAEHRTAPARLLGWI